MPEGDSIHRLAIDFNRLVKGRTVSTFETHDIADAITRTLIGCTIREVEARGKNLVIHFDDGRSLHLHLRMLGRIGIERPRSTFWRPRPPPQLRLAFGEVAIVGNRIPVVRLLRTQAVGLSPELENIGPDLAHKEFDESECVRRLQRLGPRPIGEALLVQSALAGIGNIYKSETLYLENVHPRAGTANLEESVLFSLVRRASKLLTRNLKPGPRTTRNSIGGSKLWVYRRRGFPCFRCGTAIERIYQGASPGRSTYYCPRCQTIGA